MTNIVTYFKKGQFMWYTLDNAWPITPAKSANNYVDRKIRVFMGKSAKTWALMMHVCEIWRPLEKDFRVFLYFHK